MSVIVYNGVQLPYGHTTRFEQNAVYDPSDTDRILTKFDIGVNCLISSAYASQLNPALGALTQNPANFMAWLRTRLLAQRQALSVTVNGVQLIPQPQLGKTGTVDAKNGPQPQKCDIIALNDTLFLVDYRITAHYWENYSASPTSTPIVNSNATSSNVLYNRWRESITIDDRNFTKRLRQGRFQIRSDNANGFVPDQLRTQMAVIGVPAGFLRTRNEYTVTEDGLGMDYIQEDVEYFKRPPQGAFRAEGNYRVQTAVNNTALTTCSVRLFGDASLVGGVADVSDGRAWNQLSLANKAVAIVMAKLAFLEFSRIQSATLDINMYDNEVAFTCTTFTSLNQRILRAVGTGTGPGTGGLAFFYDILSHPSSCRTPSSDTNYAVNIFDEAGNVIERVAPSQDPPPVYLARGTAGLLLEAAAYYDPSLANATVRTQGDSSVSPVKLVVTPQQTSQLPSQWQTGSPLPMPGQTG